LSDSAFQTKLIFDQHENSHCVTPNQQHS